MEPHHHHHQLLHQIQIIPSSSSFSSHHQSQEGGTITTSTSTDRFPQWSIQETKEFLMIRAELDQTFMETKRNKQLWQVISNNMKEKGYNRSPEQCKCKWKNLVTRYKGCETMEAESLRQQFPFYNELQSIFTSRMQRMLWAEGAEGTSKKNKSIHHHLSSDDEEENIIGNELLECEDQQQQKGSISRKKKKAKIISGDQNRSNSTIGNYDNNKMLSNLKKILEEFMRQQMQIEAQWIEAYEARENERRMKEIEWRQAMEALENERLIMDQRWREREEQRRIREEARAEKRDALIIALLNKLERKEM